MKKDFIGKWGMNYRDIIRMPQTKFAELYGDRFAKMGYCEFRKTVKKETPDREFVVKTPGLLWIKDRLVNRFEFKCSQRGSWDEVSVIL